MGQARVNTGSVLTFQNIFKLTNYIYCLTRSYIKKFGTHLSALGLLTLYRQSVAKIKIMKELIVIKILNTVLESQVNQ